MVSSDKELVEKLWPSALLVIVAILGLRLLSHWPWLLAFLLFVLLIVAIRPFLRTKS